MSAQKRRRKPPVRSGSTGAGKSSRVTEFADTTDADDTTEADAADTTEAGDTTEADAADTVEAADTEADPADEAAGSSDITETDEDTEAPAAPARAGSAAAAAAARARRIGGRPAVARTARSSDSGDVAPPRTDKPTKIAVSATPVAITKVAAEAGPPDEDPHEEESSAGWLLAKLSKKSQKSAEPAPEASAASATIEDDARGRSGTLLRWAPAAVLIVAAIVLAVVVAVSTHGKRWDRPSSNAERDQVLAAAKMCIVDTNSYTYKDIDALAKKGSACASGKFATQFVKTVNDLIRKNAPKSKQIQSLQVNNAGIMDVTDDNQWDVLVYGQLKVSNTANTSGAVDPFASVARVIDVNGKWRISNLCTAQFNGPINSCY